MIIDSVRNYFLNCPLIDKKSQINVDYLGVDEVQYTIDSVPVEPILKEYVDGGVMKQFVFVFGSREFYGSDVLQNMENSGFYQVFTEWIEDQNRLGNLPILEGNKKAVSLEATTQVYLFDNTEDNARYQIQCQLTYYEE